MRTWLRRTALALALLLVLIASAAGLVLAVAHGFARERLREVVETQLSAALGTPVSIEKLGGVLYREIEVEGLRIGTPAPVGDAGGRGTAGGGAERGAELAIERASLRWKGSDSIVRQGETTAISAARIVLEGLHLRIVSGQPMPWEGSESTAPTEGEDASAPLLLGLDELSLKSAQVEYVGSEGARFLFAGDGEARAFHSDASGISFEQMQIEGSASTALAAASALREFGKLEAAGAFALAVADPAATSASDELAWRVDRFRIDGPILRSQGSGSGDALGFADSSIEFESDSLTELLRELAAFEVLESDTEGRPALQGGALQGRLALRGSWDELSASGRLSAKALRSGGRRLGDLEFAARTEAPKRLRIEEFALRGGELDLRLRPGARVALSGDVVELASWTIELGPRARRIGVVTLGGRLPASAADLESASRDASLALDVAVESLSLAELRALDTSLATAIAFDRAVLDARLRFDGHPAGLRARGWSTLAATGLRSGDFSAESFETKLELSGPLVRSRGRITARAGELREGEEGRGDAALELTFTNEGAGSLPSPSTLASELEIQSLEWNGGVVPARVVPGARLRVAADGVRLRDVVFESGEQRVRAQGRIALGPADSPRFEQLALDVEALSLVWLRERLHEAGLLGPEVSVKGALAGTLRLDGALESPLLEGDLEILDFESAGIGFEKVTFQARSPAKSIELVSLWTRDGREVLRFDLASSRAELARDPLAIFDSPATRLDLEAQQFDLSVLDAFAPGNIESVRGVLDADVRVVGGTPAQVERGAFELSAGSLRIVSPRQVIGPIAAVGTLSTGAIEIQRLVIGPPQAQIVVEGRIDDLGSGDEKLFGVVRVDSYPFKLPGIAKAHLDGGLELTGRVSAPKVGGKLILSQFELWLPEANAPELKEILVYTNGTTGDGLSIQEGEEEPGVLDRVAYDIEIEMRRGSWARGRGVEAELSGELRLTKRAGGRESYSGSVRTVRGTYEVYGRRFQIERGLATLDGAATIDPVLDIVAKHRIRNVEIDALVGGRLSDPTLVFESRPDLSQTDIASYLLLGRPAATARGDDAVAVQVTAARLATGLVSSEIDRLLAPILPVDVIDLRVDSSEDEDAFALGVGKYIGERLFLRYDRRFGREATDEFRAEYELTPRISIESSAATSGEAGGDVIFNIEY